MCRHTCKFVSLTKGQRKHGLGYMPHVRAPSPLSKKKLVAFLDPGFGIL